MSGDTSERIAFAPRLPSLLIARDELVARVERESGHPLLIVRGAAGSGKSTLLALWAREHTRRGVWIALDRSAHDRLAFWRQVINGMLDAGLVPPDSVLRGIDTSVEVEPRLRNLLRRGFSTLERPVTLVIDDFHEAPDAALEDIHWLLRSDVAVRFAVATRSVSLLERPEYLAGLDTAVVLPADLALRDSEVSALAELFESPDAAAELTREFAGWALPTRATLLQLRDGTASTIEEAIARVHGVGDTFVVDLLDDSGYARFLLRISVAHRVTKAFAHEVGGPEADEHLARAERDGLGTWSDGAGITDFVLHPYLRARLEEQLLARRPDEVAEVRRAYARELSERHDLFEMARQFAAINDGEALTRLLRRHYAELIFPNGVFAGILATLDEGELRRHPELLAIQTLDSYASGRVGRPGLARLVSLTTAITFARFGGGKPVDRVSLLLVLLAAQRVGGHFDQALKTADKLVTAFGLLSDEDRDALHGLLPRAWVQVATTYLYNEQPARAEEALAVALDIGGVTITPRARLHAESLQNLIIAMRGDLAALAPRLEQARTRQQPAEWRGSFSATGYHLAEAYQALERFDGQAAREQLDQLAEHEATIEHWPLMARVRALAAVVEGRPYLGLQTLAENIDAHADRPPTSASMTALLTSSRAELLLADGQPLRAAEVLKTLRRAPAGQLVRARAGLALGNNDQALGLAAPLAWSNENLPRAKAEALLVVAAASRRLGQTADARAAVERAMALMSTYGLRRPWLAVPRHDLIEVLEASGIPALDVLEGVPDFSPPSNRDWSLTATELRVLALLETTGRIDELAAELGVSANTVKSHLRQVYRKLGVGSRAEALGVAGLHGLLADGQPDDTGSRTSAR